MVSIAIAFTSERTLGVRLLASVVMLCASCISAKAQTSLFQSHFASAAGGEPCYARSFTADHMKEHPAQRVTGIQLDLAKANPDGKPITEESIELGFGLKVKDKPGWYTSAAICKSAGDQMDCFLEGDGGRFTLVAAANGALKLSTGEYGLAIEGSSDFVEIAGDAGDDRIFVLGPGEKTACAAAAAGAPVPILKPDY